MGTHVFCVEEDMLGTFYHHGYPPCDVLLSSIIVIINMMSVGSVCGLNFSEASCKHTYVFTL
jgi:hypothetical protein